LKLIDQQVVPWIALTIVSLLAFFVMLPFLVPIAWAGILCYTSWPIAERIRAWCNGRDTLAAATTSTLVTVMLLLPLIWMTWFLETPYQTPSLLIQQPWLNDLFGDWLAQLVATASNAEGLSSIIKPWLSTNLGNIANVAGDIGKNVIKLAFVILILFFFYRDGPSGWHDYTCCCLRYITHSLGTRLCRRAGLLGRGAIITCPIWHVDCRTGIDSFLHPYCLGCRRAMVTTAGRNWCRHWRLVMGCVSRQPARQCAPPYFHKQR